jgi:hypothetical protein
MINQFRPESQGGHLGEDDTSSVLWLAGEELRKLWGPEFDLGSVAEAGGDQRRDVEEVVRVLMQNHSSAH